MYIFDTSPFSTLFKNFYRRRFPTLWAQFDGLVEDGTITSTREVGRELERYGNEECQEWLRNHREIFTTPTAAEANVVRHIYEGGLNADPFVIAKAAVNQGTVVTLERAPPNAARIPNICHHFNVNCLTLEEFMEAEGWIF